MHLAPLAFQSLGCDQKSNSPLRQRVPMHQLLEPLAVVGLDEVSKLMHNYIVLHPLGEPGQPIAYANGPGGAVAGPASPLLALGVLNVVPGQTSLKISMV